MVAYHAVEWFDFHGYFNKFCHLSSIVLCFGSLRQKGNKTWRFPSKSPKNRIDFVSVNRRISYQIDARSLHQGCTWIVSKMPRKLNAKFIHIFYDFRHHLWIFSGILRTFNFLVISTVLIRSICTESLTKLQISASITKTSGTTAASDVEQLSWCSQNASIFRYFHRHKQLKRAADAYNTCRKFSITQSRGEFIVLNSKWSWCYGIKVVEIST